MAKAITLNEMRDRVGALIFGADWIGSLTDPEGDLLNEYPFIARDIRRTDGTTISLPHVEPIPARLAPKIDRARGRLVRMDAQYVTVDTWLQAHGVFDYVGKVIDRKWFSALIRAENNKQEKTAAPERRRGPKAQILPRVIADMERQITEGILTRADLADLPDKELATQFSASRNRVRAARAHVLNGHG